MITREAGLSAPERARNWVENDLKSMGSEAQNSPYSGPFAYKRKIKVPVFSPINLPSQTTLIPSSILTHPQAPLELWAPIADPHRRLNFPLRGKYAGVARFQAVIFPSIIGPTRPLRAENPIFRRHEDCLSADLLKSLPIGRVPKRSKCE